MKNPFFILLLLISSIGNAQFTEPKFGKIDMSELTMTKYEPDSSAEALLLFDNGYSKFDISQDRKFQIVYTRHFRIKIFKASAFQLADIHIRLFSSNGSTEKLYELKAVTYNLVDGKIVKTKLDNDKIYIAESKTYMDKKFAFPEVKEGSVLELSYTIMTPFLYNLRGWNFQHSYPALWSQYRYSIPEFFNYRENSKGYLLYDVHKNDESHQTFNIHFEHSLSDIGMRGQLNSDDYDMKAKTEETTLAIKDIPAFIAEPNIDCEDNYLQSIEFELRSIQYPNDTRKDYTQTWESVNKEMKESEDFGLLLKSGGFISDTVEYLCSNKSSEIEKANTIYKYIQRRMVWNDNYSMWSIRGLKKPFNDHSGNSSEINLLLTLMLQKAGLNANPVLFSTRDNGIANTYYPTITKFNSVLSRVEIEGKSYLLDATSKYCPFGVLPANDINGQGRIVNNLEGDWANLESGEKYKESKSYVLEITPEGKFKGLILGSYSGYAGIAYRNNLNSGKNSNDYIRKMQENIKGLTINNFVICDRYNIDKPLNDSLFVEISDHADLMGDKILFHPLLLEEITKNKYTLEDRKYPVNYNYPISETYIFNYTIPEGYQVESLPKSVTIKFPDNSISIAFNLQNIENKITISYRRNINKIMFLPDEYKILKEFYDQLVKKHSEQIILKKIA